MSTTAVMSAIKLARGVEQLGKNMGQGRLTTPSKEHEVHAAEGSRRVETVKAVYSAVKAAKTKVSKERMADETQALIKKGHIHSDSESSSDSE